MTLTNIPSTFVTSIEGRLTGAGPIYGTILATTIDSIGPAGRFATFSVDDTKITPSGATIRIVDQTIDVIDMGAFLAFVKAVLQGERCGIRLFARAATMKAFLVRKTIGFSKVAEVGGWKGVKGWFVGFKGGKVVIKIDSLSQTGIDFGVAGFEVRDEDGRVLAELRGQLKVEKGETFHEFDVRFVPGGGSGVKVGDVLRLVGVSGVPQTWLDDAIKFFGVDVVVNQEWIEAANTQKLQVLVERSRLES